MHTAVVFVHLALFGFDKLGTHALLICVLLVMVVFWIGVVQCGTSIARVTCYVYYHPPPWPAGWSRALSGPRP